MKRIFYIYTEATIACMMLAASLIEFVCGFVIPEGLNILAFCASGFFLMVAVQQVSTIIKAEQA